MNKFDLKNRLLSGSLAIAILLTVLAGCSSNDPSKQISKMLRREVVLPEVSMVQYAHTHDGGHLQLTEEDIDVSSYLNAKYKIVMYIDPAGCVSCNLDFHQIEEMILYFKDIFPELELLLYVHYAQSDENTVRRQMQLEHYHLPVFMDVRGEFKNSNRWLPQDSMFHTFLIDRLNRIVAVGSPLRGEEMVTLYQRALSKLESNNGLLEGL